MSDHAAELQEWLIAFVRDFGLHEPDRTPCGQPMSVSEAHALTELARQPVLRQRELGERLRLQKSTISRLVTQLTRRGWVRRAPAHDDGRGVALALTERGAAAATRVETARRNRCAALLDNIPFEQHAEVLSALRLLKEAIDVNVTTR